MDLIISGLALLGTVGGAMAVGYIAVQILTACDNIAIIKKKVCNED